MRFKLDENMPLVVKPILESAGHMVSTIPEEGLSGASDVNVMEVCRGQGLALMTLDLDFSSIVSYPPGSHSGIFVLRLRRLDASTVEQSIRKLTARTDLNALSGAIVIVEPARIRVRAAE